MAARGRVLRAPAKQKENAAPFPASQWQYWDCGAQCRFLSQNSPYFGKVFHALGTVFMKTEKKNRILSNENTICNRLQNGKHKLCTNQKRSNYAKCRLFEKNDLKELYCNYVKRVRGEENGLDEAEEKILEELLKGLKNEADNS